MDLSWTVKVSSRIGGGCTVIEHGKIDTMYAFRGPVYGYTRTHHGHWWKSCTTSVLLMAKEGMVPIESVPASIRRLGPDPAPNRPLSRRICTADQRIRSGDGWIGRAVQGTHAGC